MENSVYYLLGNGIGIPRYMYRFFVDQQETGLRFLFAIQYYFKLKAGTTVQRGVLRVFVLIQLLTEVTFTKAAGFGFCAVLT